MWQFGKDFTSHIPASFEQAILRAINGKNKLCRINTQFNAIERETNWQRRIFDGNLNSNILGRCKPTDNPSWREYFSIPMPSHD